MRWLRFIQTHVRLILASFLTAGFGFACSEPIKRDITPPPVPEVEVKKDYLVPDLKKRLWILKFADVAKTPVELKTVSVSELIQIEIRKSIGGDKSPYLAQTEDDEKAFVGFQLGDQSDPSEVARRLRGSDVAGFIVGRITDLSTSDVGSESPGILKSKTTALRLAISYDLYDTNTAHKIYSGKENELFTETRSDFLGIQIEMPELNRKVAAMARDIGKKIVKKVIPYAEKLAWSGRVLRIEGGRVYINAGRLTGLMVGDVLKVIEAPKEIQDPQNGNFVGSAPGRLKATVKLLQYFGNDGAVAVLQSGGGIYPGDRVELY